MQVRPRSIVHRIPIALVLALTTLAPALTGCQPPDPPSALPRVMFAMDFSASATSWMESQIRVVRQWLSLHPEDLNASVIALDPTSGSHECVAATAKIVGEGNNETTRKRSRDKAVNDFLVNVRDFATCQQKQPARGSDLMAWPQFTGADHLVLITDGIVRVPGGGGEITLSRKTLTNTARMRAIIAQAVKGADPTALEGMDIEIYGMGWQANLNANQVRQLSQLWTEAITSRGGQIVTLSSDLNPATTSNGA